jgi:hypothetical protein
MDAQTNRPAVAPTGQVADETKNYSAGYGAAIRKGQERRINRPSLNRRASAHLPTGPVRGTKYTEDGPTASKVRTNSYLERLA